MSPRVKRRGTQDLFPAVPFLCKKVRLRWRGAVPQRPPKPQRPPRRLHPILQPRTPPRRPQFSTQGADRGSTTFTQGWGHSTTRRLPTSSRGEIATHTTKMFHQGSSHNRKSSSQGSPPRRPRTTRFPNGNYTKTKLLW